MFTGLNHWAALGNAGHQLRYDWAADYGQPVTQRGVANFTLNATSNWILSLGLVAQVIGPGPAGIAAASGMPLSTYDHDSNGLGCGPMTQSPWWYGTPSNCAKAAGSLVGGGELSGTNGAYYTGSEATPGNGWIFVR